MPEDIELNEDEEQALDAAWDELETDPEFASYKDADEVDGEDGEEPTRKKLKEKVPENKPHTPPLQQIAGEVMEKLSKINDPVRKDWFMALLHVALDDHAGDAILAFKQASEVFDKHPEPVGEAIRDDYPAKHQE